MICFLCFYGGFRLALALLTISGIRAGWFPLILFRLLNWFIVASKVLDMVEQMACFGPWLHFMKTQRFVPAKWESVNAVTSSLVFMALLGGWLWPGCIPLKIPFHGMTLVDRPREARICSQGHHMKEIQEGQALLLLWWRDTEMLGFVGGVGKKGCTVVELKQHKAHLVCPLSYLF